jgi:asparagine synthase (glutamine-hydrolysing)
LLSINAEGRQSLRTYWAPPEGVEVDRGVAETAGRLRSVLEAAVERQLVADVPVGVFLSGGLDSSTVTGLAARAVSGPLRTFAVGFEGPGAVSELPFAREVADHFGTDHHELMMDPAEVESDLETIVDGLDAPLADPTAIPTWYMSRLARERVTVALSGEGADEIFGGYARQRYDVAMDRFGGAGRTILPLRVRAAGRRPSAKLRQRLRMDPGLARQLDWGRVFAADDIDAVVAAGSASEDAMLAGYEGLEHRWHELAVGDPVNGRLMTDREIFLPADLLVKVDRMSMAHSLEVRVPYLDNEVADLMLALPGRFKQSLLRDKILLRSAAASVLPSSASRRKKRGFEVPIGAWLRADLQPSLLDWLAPETIRRQGLLEPREVSRMTEEHLRGRGEHGKALWALMVLSRWLERNRAA